jgi:hypothetical protein
MIVDITPKGWFSSDKPHSGQANAAADAKNVVPYASRRTGAVHNQRERLRNGLADKLLFSCTHMMGITITWSGGICHLSQEDDGDDLLWTGLIRLSVPAG